MDVSKRKRDFLEQNNTHISKKRVSGSNNYFSLNGITSIGKPGRISQDEIEKENNPNIMFVEQEGGNKMSTNSDVFSNSKKIKIKKADLRIPTFQELQEKKRSSSESNKARSITDIEESIVLGKDLFNIDNIERISQSFIPKEKEIKNEVKIYSDPSTSTEIKRLNPSNNKNRESSKICNYYRKYKTSPRPPQIKFFKVKEGSSFYKHKSI